MLRTTCRIRCLIRFSRLLCRQPWLSTYYTTVAPATTSPQISVTTIPAFTALPASSSPPLTLRPYQEECITAVLTAFGEGRRQVGVSLATGSGKTVIFTELIGRAPEPTPYATKSLILVHRQELVEQAAKHSARRYPNKRVETEMGSMHASGQADITVASIQSIVSKDRIEKFVAESYKLVLVDEAHHIVSPSYLKVLGHFGFIKENGDHRESTPALLGVSATLSRLDGLALGKVIKDIVYHKDYVDMIGEKWLSNVSFTTVVSRADLSKVKKNNLGDFKTSELSKAMNTSETNLITVRAWQHKASGRHSTIVFCVDLDHVRTLTKTFRAHGIDARFVTGDTQKTMRSERLDAFRRKEFPVLINCGVFTEGTDIPNIDCVLLARPTKSRNLLVQMIGRGMRLYAGKENCQIIDMVASLKTGIVSTPTLFGLDPSEIVEDLNHDQMRKLKERREREKLREKEYTEPAVRSDTTITQQPIKSTITFTDYDSVADLIEDTSGDRHIRAISPHTWVAVAEDRYVLVNGGNGSFISLEKTAADQYKVTLTSKLHSPNTGSPFMRPRTIVTASTFEAAVRGADTFAATQFTRALITIYARGNNWRDGPASQAQVEILNKYRDEDHQLSTADVTKGKAGDMITKIKFGARGRFNAIAAQKKKEAKEARKREVWEVQREREVVRVGPVAVG